MKRLLVYIHIPFCTSKCHFCDWVTEIPASSLRLNAVSSQRRNYIEAVKTQIRHFGPILARKSYRPDILYWGGGTASILTPGEISVIMQALGEEFDLSSLREATIECSPETLDTEKLRLFIKEGFRRISIGIQSLDNQRLRSIGRAHTAEQAVESVRTACEAGFEQINIDLISGFPGETLEEFDSSLRQALQLPANHVSLYPYRPAQGTIMVRQLNQGIAGKTRLEEQLEAYALGQILLEEAGLKEYALSHFGALPCYSDLAYFQLQMDWIGFGSGATSLIEGEYMATERGRLDRFTSQPLCFDESFPSSSLQITPRLIYQSLSMPEGVIKDLWEERTGVELEEILRQEPVSQLVQLLEKMGGMIRDEKGLRIPSQNIAQAFIRLLFLNAPLQSQEMQTARGVFGSY